MPSRINFLYIWGLIKRHIDWLSAPIRGKKAQVWAEYTVIIVLVVMAIVTMQVYLQRQLQGRYRDATNYALRTIINAKGAADVPLQYEPYYNETEITKAASSQIRESYLPGGINTTEIIREQTLGQGIERELPYSDNAE